MSNFCPWVVGIATGTAIAFSANLTIAQVIPTPDATLPKNSQVTKDTTNEKIINIEGGTKVGSNLFHSFKDFSVPAGSTAYFKNTENIQNVITRVTGKSISDIQGSLKADGTANLFLINPNGIVFGANASLQIGGSFITSTASSLNFADGTKFSATNPQTTPLLTVSVPIGLQFGATAAPIINQSQAKSPDGITNSSGSPVGLQVKPDKTLALVGGDITLEGGNLTATSGLIELGSVAANSLVSLNSINQGWSLGYEQVKDFQNIRLGARTDNGSEVPSQVYASNKDGNEGNIQVRGNSVELTGYFVFLRTLAEDTKNAGDLTINTRKLIVRDGAQVSTGTVAEGNGGHLTVNASESVEVIGGFIDPDGKFTPSTLFSSTAAGGNAGDIKITTARLRIQDGGNIGTESLGFVFFQNQKLQYLPATGKGGNLTVNASESVELVGGFKDNGSDLNALTNGSNDAGKITITTGKLIVRDKATITVSSQVPKFTRNYTYLGDPSQLGSAGELNIIARSILVDNQGKFTSEAQSGKGGNINLQVQDLLLMRRNSQITTNAGTAQSPGDGGNITIKAPNGFIVATPLGNNDITANAFSGSGGKITINANQIFGFVPRTRADLERLLQTQDPNKLDPSNLPTSDITAFSQQNPSLNGIIQINTPNIDPNKGLVELPVNLVDASQLIAPSCNTRGKINPTSFVVTGNGGIAASPTEPLIDNPVLADWITLEGEKIAGDMSNKVVIQKPEHTKYISQTNNYVNSQTQIVEAQGWVVDSNGNVVLVAAAPSVTPHSQAINPASCAVNN